MKTYFLSYTTGPVQKFQPELAPGVMRFIKVQQPEPGMRPAAVTDLLSEFGSRPRNRIGNSQTIEHVPIMIGDPCLLLRAATSSLPVLRSPLRRCASMPVSAKGATKASNGDPNEQEKRMDEAALRGRPRGFARHCSDFGRPSGRPAVRCPPGSGRAAAEAAAARAAAVRGYPGLHAQGR